MIGTELALTLFATCNSVRVLAYLPQIVSLARDRSGARAVSCLTWILFAISNLSTALYAHVVVQDGSMTAVFMANTACCALIVTIAACKRRRSTGSGPDRAPAVAGRQGCRFASLFDASHSDFVAIGRQQRAQFLGSILVAGSDWLCSATRNSLRPVPAARLS